MFKMYSMIQKVTKSLCLKLRIIRRCLLSDRARGQRGSSSERSGPRQHDRKQESDIFHGNEMQPFSDKLMAVSASSIAESCPERT